MTYRDSIARTMTELMERDDRVVLAGIGVGYPPYCYNTTEECAMRWPDRVIEFPCSEMALGGWAVGMALQGWKPIVIHGRSNFFMLQMDMLVNHILNAGELYGRTLPIVFRLVSGQDDAGQGCQHQFDASQLLCALRIQYSQLHTHSNCRDVYTRAIGSAGPSIVTEYKRLYECELDC